MKFTQLFHYLFKPPVLRTYGDNVVPVELAQGTIEFAEWLHPNERSKLPTQPEIDELMSFLRPGDFCIDIGAKTGDTSVPMALACGLDGACLAFEPNPFTYPLLEKNARLNAGHFNIFPQRLAVAEQDGSITFYYSDAGYSNGGLIPGTPGWRHGHMFPIEVQAARLETVLAEYPDRLARLRYIKIDAEGYDPDILQSIRSILEQHRPYLRVEIYKRLNDEKRRLVYGLLIALGYKIWRAKGPAYLRGEAISSRYDMHAHRSFDIFAEPPAKN